MRLLACHQYAIPLPGMVLGNLLDGKTRRDTSEGKIDRLIWRRRVGMEYVVDNPPVFAAKFSGQ